MHPTVTSEQHTQVVLDYWADSENQKQRLGQYLMNTLLPDCVCPAVFYCEDPKQASFMFYTYYVE